MYVLGINSVYHESSACLVEDGSLVATAEEERFNRRKHGKEARADNPDELPVRAIDFCLDAAGIALPDVEHVACAADPEEMARVRREGLPSAWSSPEKQALFLATLPEIPRKLAALGSSATFHWVPHHTAHAGSAFYVSPHDAAAVLVVDALGDDAYSTRFYHGRDRGLTPLHGVRYPFSLGYLWELVSVFLGFGVYDAAKVMGLAAYGHPDRFAEAFRRLAWRLPDGGFAMAHELLRFHDILYYPPSAYLEGLQRVLGVAPRTRGEPLLDDHHDVAAALQRTTDELVAHMAEHLHRLTRSRNLCLAGGVALNCVTNAHVFAAGPYEHLYVQPAAHDGGLALGAAFHVWHETLGQPRSIQMGHAYWGPAFTAEEIEGELRRHAVDYAKVDDLESTVARLIDQEHVVGFFQGAMELGPRALGNRSILADPRHRRIREILNHRVKHREYFRPFAPSVLHEEAREWFEIDKETPAADFMLMAYRARPDKLSRLEAVAHVDGTCRIQTVRQSVNPTFHRVIAAFRDLTGVPMVLNTSFNDEEPIICTPADALATFLKTRIDYLAIGPFVAWKEDVGVPFREELA